ncbi:MAG: hypothetical protein IJ706_08250 [Clostridia bacterium]|nr:hypothetical protein [Clostridia bacterium]
MINDFGFDSKRYEERMERFAEQHKKSGRDPEEMRARYQKKTEAFNTWFIDKECDTVLSLLREIETNFTVGNSIHPVYYEEYLERRRYIDAAIGFCFALKQEMQYIIRTLPVNMDKFKNYSLSIDEQIRLYRGVRKADNRFLKEIKGLPLCVVSAANFANVNNNGNANNNGASNANGVRPDSVDTESKTSEEASIESEGEVVLSGESPINDSEAKSASGEQAKAPYAMRPVTTEGLSGV